MGSRAGGDGPGRNVSCLSRCVSRRRTMLDQLLTQFLDHLRYERNVSAHTLRNYESDLRQFFDHLAPADPNNAKRKEPKLAQIDHLTIREWLSTLHSDKKKKTSIARKLAAL